MKLLKTLFGMVIFGLAIPFSVQNQDWVTLRFGLYLGGYHWEVSKVPIFLVVLCSIFSGILMGGFGDLYGHFLLKRRLR